MPIPVKICGLSTPETRDAAIAHGCALVGLIFYPPSPRNLAVDEAAALASGVPRHVRRVGVFVDPAMELLDHAVASARLDVVQLHRSSPALLQAARTRFPATEIWAAIAIRTAADLVATASYRGLADRILYDAKTPAGGLPGGMGVRFDWTLLRGFNHPLPWALSGGLDADNLEEAVRITAAPLLDVSSGVETAPGVKDVAKIAAFLKAAASL